MTLAQVLAFDEYPALVERFYDRRGLYTGAYFSGRYPFISTQLKVFHLPQHRTALLQIALFCL